MARRNAKQAPKRRTPAEIQAIQRLQNNIRNAINASVDRHHKLGVEPGMLKKAMAMYGIDPQQISLRQQRLPASSDLHAEYKLFQDGELLFRLKLVPYEHDLVSARWHVKRHPEATWWRERSAQRMGQRLPR